MPNLRQTLRGANEIRYANPLNFKDVTTVKVNSKPKKAGSRTVQNVRSALSSQRTAALPVKPGCETCTVDEETLSCSVVLSGSVDSKAALLLLWSDTKAQIDLVFADTSTGFLPDGVTLPFTENPVA